MKPITIFCNLRDSETGEVVGNSEAYGNTEDEGVTCVIGLGYLPQLVEALPGDIKVTVHQPVVEYPAAEVISVMPDEENNLQTVVFDLSE